MLIGLALGFYLKAVSRNNGRLIITRNVNWNLFTAQYAINIYSLKTYQRRMSKLKIG